jgi:hypothetical protein
LDVPIGLAAFFSSERKTQNCTRTINLLVSLCFHAALASHKRVYARLGRATASGLRGNSFKSARA